MRKPVRVCRLALVALAAAIVATQPAQGAWRVAERIDTPGDPAGDRFGDLVVTDGDAVLVLSSNDHDLGVAGASATFFPAAFQDDTR